MNKVELTGPFSCNDMYYCYNNRFVKTKKYKEWLKSNISIVSKIRPIKIYPVTVNVQIIDGYGWSDFADPNNLIKPIADLIVKSKVIIDDRSKYIDDININFKPFFNKKSPMILTLEIIESPEILTEWILPYPYFNKK